MVIRLKEPSMYQRNCPQCNEIIVYTNKYYYNNSVKANRKCRKCGDINGNKTKWSDPNIREKMIKNNKRFSGKTHSEQTKQEMSNSRKGELHPMYGKHINEKTKRALSIANKNKVFTDEYRQKLSLALKKRKLTEEHKQNISLGIRKYIIDCFPSGPIYNKTACKIFDEINKEMGWNGRHAENGGEFCIKELGYWVDYYEPTLNLVIEYDETRHKYKIEKDKKRQVEIETLLRCKFFRLPENTDWRQILK